MGNAVAKAKTAERRPAVAPALLGAVFDELPDAILLFDSENHLMSWNARLYQLFPSLVDDLAVGDSFDLVSARLDALEEEGLTRHSKFLSDGLLLLSLRRSKRMMAHRRRFSDADLGRLRAIIDPVGELDGFRRTRRGVSMRNDKERDGERIQRHLLDAVEYLSHGLVLFDAAGRLVLCNERFRQFFPQVLAVQGSAISYRDFVRSLAEGWMSDPGAIGQWVDEHVDRHRLGLTHECQALDGRWFLVRDLRLPDGSTVMTGTDITGLKRRETALRESEARFRAIFQHAAVGVAVIRSGGRIVQTNPALDSMLGYAAGELVAMRYRDLVHPDDLVMESRLARRLIDGEIDSFRHESRYLHKSGRHVWGRLTVSLVRGHGDDNFGIAMIENIDERKQAESDLMTFRAVAEAAAEAIVILSLDGTPFYVNPAHKKLFGPCVAGEHRHHYWDHYAEDAQKTIRQFVLPSLERGLGWEGILNAKAADGRVFPVWQRAGTVCDGDGRPQFHFVFMHDHSHQQRTRDELCKAKELAEQANIAKTRFLAAASHDLRQPLQALSMFVAVLSSRTHTPEDALLIKRIDDSVGAVETLLNGLLDVSKLEAGLVVPAPAAFDISPLLSRLASEFQPLAAEEGLRFHLVTSHAVVRSDPALLERILRNLLNNAVRYTKHGRVLLGCRRRRETLVIEVWDTGIGIPQNQLKLIFREFHQLGNSARDRRQGLGLGLAIVDRLSQLLDHRIDVASEPQKGSVFSIEVPLAKSPAITHQPRQLPLGIRQRDATILIIEDEPDVLESTGLLLESWGFNVLSAKDCDEALHRMMEWPHTPDLILADYRLQSGTTGAQAVNLIRARLKTSLPAIILTGDTAPERLRQAKASGHGLLHKPVQPVALHRMIDEALAASEAGLERSSAG